MHFKQILNLNHPQETYHLHNDSLRSTLYEHRMYWIGRTSWLMAQGGWMRRARRVGRSEVDLAGAAWGSMRGSAGRGLREIGEREERSIECCISNQLHFLANSHPIVLSWHYHIVNHDRGRELQSQS